jgi:branched-subunit amino acid transport protein
VNAWTVILLAGLASYVLRGALVVTDRLRMPSGLDDTLGLVAPAAFTALTVTSLATPMLADLTPHGVIPPLLAASAGVVAVIRTGKPYAAMLAGMPTYWLAALLPA